MKPVSEQTLYELLDLPPDASAQEIARAVARAEALYAPGSLVMYALMTPDEAELLGRRLAEARTTLLDPGHREAYDARLLADGTRGSAPAAPAVTPRGETTPPVRLPPAPAEPPRVDAGSIAAPPDEDDRWHWGGTGAAATEEGPGDPTDPLRTAPRARPVPPPRRPLRPVAIAAACVGLLGAGALVLRAAPSHVAPAPAVGAAPPAARGPDPVAAGAAAVAPTPSPTLSSPQAPATSAAFQAPAGAVDPAPPRIDARTRSRRATEHASLSRVAAVVTPGPPTTTAETAEPDEVTQLLARARQQRRRGQPKQALGAYARVLELQPRNADALAGRAWCYFEQSQYEPARAAFQQALAADWAHPDALIGMAEVERYEGHGAAAIQAYQRYVIAHPHGEFASAARAAISSLSE